MGMKEWRDIDGFDGYQVSNLGNVRSLNYNGTKNIQLLKSSLSGPNRGYKSISMQVADKVIRRNIHRLVAMAFIPNPNNLPEVNHIDEDGTNNKVNNLEWCDRKYNFKVIYTIMFFFLFIFFNYIIQFLKKRIKT